MGSSNFFAKFASIDPLAQMLNLPGAHKYAQAQAQSEAGKAGASGGPYTGVDPTLAGANAGYTPGGPGATTGWSQYAPRAPGGLFGLMQKGSNLAGNLTPLTAPLGKPLPLPNPSTTNQYVQPNTTANPWVLAVRGQQNPQWGTQ